MNGKRSGVAEPPLVEPEPQSRRPAAAGAVGRAPADLAAAMDTLVHGYREESELYRLVRGLTWRQRDMLCGDGDLDRFSDLLEEKEDLLRMIGEIESVMKGAKSLVLSRTPSQCPNRWTLEKLLDQLTAMIEEIRAIEGANAALLESALTASC